MIEQTWEDRLAEILKKEPAALTPGDIEFLRARRSYLDDQQLSLYAEVLGTEKPEKPSKKKSE
ncbi:MAG TPA: hypothetical protein VKB38_13205 [Terracidiphilus sp.]|nr:hypothetical protein [Terracidiphilus sp.]